uniref:Atg6 BARA domain-containing protein n=1 Tax=Timema genevievae TaxID=629358 RepID=A0A7R9K084_TIMGE|nr:unnamed protein product [Timema genevievae]
MDLIKQVLAEHRALPLYGSGGFRFLWDTKFDAAMVAFLDCLQQFKEEVEKGDSGFCLPYKMERGKIEDSATGNSYSIKSTTGVMSKLKLKDDNLLLIVANQEGQSQQLDRENVQLREEGKKTQEEVTKSKLTFAQIAAAGPSGRPGARRAKERILKEIQSKVMSKLNPAKDRIKIRSIRPAGKGVVGETETKEDTNKVRQSILVLEGLKCEDPRKRRPLVTIFDIQEFGRGKGRGVSPTMSLRSHLRVLTNHVAEVSPRVLTNHVAEVSPRVITNHVAEVSPRVLSLLVGGRLYL